jgi:hypothetical protein
MLDGLKYFLQMEDDLNYFQIEDDLNYFQIEDDWIFIVNRRWPQNGKWLGNVKPDLP